MRKYIPHFFVSTVVPQQEWSAEVHAASAQAVAPAHDFDDGAHPNGVLAVSFKRDPNTGQFLSTHLHYDDTTLCAWHGSEKGVHVCQELHDGEPITKIMVAFDGKSICGLKFTTTGGNSAGFLPKMKRVKEICVPKGKTVGGFRGKSDNLLRSVQFLFVDTPKQRTAPRTSFWTPAVGAERSTGTHFNDGLNEGGVHTITAYYVYGWNGLGLKTLVGLKTTYRTTTGPQVHKHGICFSPFARTFQLQENECIQRVSLSEYEGRIISISFSTNNGRLSNSLVTHPAGKSYDFFAPHGMYLASFRGQRSPFKFNEIKVGLVPAPEPEFLFQQLYADDGGDNATYEMTVTRGMSTHEGVSTETRTKVTRNAEIEAAAYVAKMKAGLSVEQETKMTEKISFDTYNLKEETVVIKTAKPVYFYQAVFKQQVCDSSGTLHLVTCRGQLRVLNEALPYSA